MPKIPIFVLISRYTFSCAEDFAFCLQNLGRAVIIGETTRGGAHDAKMWTFPSESISLQIPFNEAVDPRTKKTWEGIGITPDIQVPAQRAFCVAMLEAAKVLRSSATEDDRKALMVWIIEDYRTQLDSPVTTPATLQVYTGSYDSYKVRLEGGQLALYFDERMNRRLIPFAEDVFKLDNDDRHGYSTHRVLFTRDGSGEVSALEIIDSDGNRSRKARSGTL